MSLQCDTPGNMNTGFNDMFICLNWMIDRRIWYWQDHHILFSIFSLSHSVHSGYCNYHTNFSRCLSHHICIYTQETTIFLDIQSTTFCFVYSGHHRAQYSATTAWVPPGGLHQETLTRSHFINLQTKVLPQGRILKPEIFYSKLRIWIFLKILQMFVFQTKSDKNVGFSHLDQCTPKFIAKKVIKLLPALCEHLERSSGFFQVG